MKCVADGKAGMQSVGSHDDRNPLGRFSRIPAVGFFDQRSVWNPVRGQVVMAYAALAKAWIFSTPAGGDDEGGHVLAKQIEPVIKARPQHRRRAAVIFGRPENNNRIRGMPFIGMGLANDGNAGVEIKSEAGHQQ